MTVSTGLCSGRELVNVAQVTYPVFNDITTTLTEATSTGGRGPQVVQTSLEVTLLAPMFQLNYQASDLAQTTAPPTAQVSRPSPSESSGSPPIASNSGGSDSVPGPLPSAADQGGLSTGAVVGIGVGAALGGILLGVLSILFFIRKRKVRAAHVELPDNQQQPTEHPQYDYKYATEMPVWNQTNRTELWSHPAAHEMSLGSERWSHNHRPNPGDS